MALPLPVPADAAPRPAGQPYEFSIRPLSAPARKQIRDHRFWHKGCPVGLSGLRMLTVTYRGYDGDPHPGRMVVNASAAPPLARVFRKLYALHFPVRHMSFEDFYGPI